MDKLPPQSKPTEPLPAGIVLGKDGKPCRTCTDTAAWRALTRSMKGSSPSTSPNIPSKITPAAAISAASIAGAASVPALSPATSSQQQSECPPDVQELGRSTWTLLHTLAATYPSAATADQKAEMGSFLTLFAKLYPCWVCAEDFQVWMKKEKPVLDGRSGFGDWMCRAHNEVNRKLGKKEFDCRFWEERWRDGWKDGRCE